MQHLSPGPVFFRKLLIMKDTLLLAAATMLSLLAFSQNDVIDDKNADKRNVTGFHAIRISGGIDLYFSQGAEAVAVSAANTSDRDRIVTEVSNRVLNAVEASGGSDSYISSGSSNINHKG
jgi:hypothetical protein